MTTDHRTDAVLDPREQEAMDHILAAMQIITEDWKLKEGTNLSTELCLHVHGLQGFVIQHMLQRLGGWGVWYDDPALIASKEAA